MYFFDGKGELFPYYDKLNLTHFDWFLRMVHWRTDAQMRSPLTTFCCFNTYEVIVSMLPWICSEIDHQKVRKSVTHSAASSASLFVLTTF